MGHGFKLPFAREQSDELAARFRQNEQDMVNERAAFAAGDQIACGAWTLDALKPIVRWKSQRALPLVRENDPYDIEDALRTMCSGATDRAKTAVLTGLRGVLVPMASAILTAVNRQRFTVIDRYVLGSLLGWRAEPTIGLYADYLDFCRREARALGVSLRTLDRALWQWGKDQEEARHGREHA